MPHRGLASSHSVSERWVSPQYLEGGLCVPQLASSALWTPHSQGPTSACRERSVFLKAGFAGLGDTFQIHLHPLCVEHTCWHLQRTPARKHFGALISNLQDHKAKWPPGNVLTRPLPRDAGLHSPGRLADGRACGWSNAISVEEGPGHPRWDLSATPFLSSRDLVPSFSLLLISPPIFPLFWLVLLSM